MSVNYSDPRVFLTKCAFSNAAWLRLENCVSVQKQHGDTALIMTASSGRLENMRMLLEAGANKDAKDKVCGLMRIVQKLMCLCLCVNACIRARIIIVRELCNKLTDLLLWPVDGWRRNA